jgi:hypothetical protein
MRLYIKEIEQCSQCPNCHDKGANYLCSDFLPERKLFNNNRIIQYFCKLKKSLTKNLE